MSTKIEKSIVNLNISFENDHGRSAITPQLICSIQGMHLLFFNILKLFEVTSDRCSWRRKKSTSSGRKPYKGSVRGLLEVDLGKNSRDITHFLFFNILKGPPKNGLKLLLTHVPGAEKSPRHQEGSLIKGASEA